MKRVLTYIYLLLCITLLAPTPARAVATNECDSCSRANCCGRTCGSNQSCNGSLRYGCTCETNVPAPTDVPQDPDPTGTGTGTGTGSTCSCVGTYDKCDSPTFPVCDKTGGFCSWTCTSETVGGSCTSWSAWSSCSNDGSCVKTRYCNDNNNSGAQAVGCSDGLGCGGGGGGSTPTSTQMSFCVSDPPPSPTPNYLIAPYTTATTGSSYTNDPAGIYSCQTNLGLYWPYQTTGICYPTQAAAQANCCRPVYWCDNTGSVRTTINPYYSNTFLDCTNGYTTSCTQNLQAAIPPSSGSALYNYNCYATMSQAQANCITPTIPVPTPTPPAPPTNLSVSCSGLNAVISWSASTGATSYAYRINNLANAWIGNCGVAQYAGDACVDGYPNTSYSFTTVNLASYDWWVHAIGTGGWSGGVSGPRLQCCVGQAPTNAPVVSALSSCVGNSTVQLNWSFAGGWGVGCGGANTYSIRDGATTIISGLVSTDFSETVTLSAGAHSLSVCANNGAGSTCSTAQAITVDGSAPAIPALTHTLSEDPSCRGKYFLTASWAAVADSSCGGLNSTPYWLQVSDSSSFSTINAGWTLHNTWENMLSATSTISYSPNSTLYTHIRSRDSFDNQSVWSSTNTVVIPVPSPYPTIHIGGTYREDVGSTEGSLCDDGILINPGSLSIMPTIMPVAGVSSSCSILSSSYGCDIVIDNQNGACFDPNLTVNIVAEYSGYETVGLRTGSACTGDSLVDGTGGNGETGITASAGGAPLSDQPLYFRSAGLTSGGWFKLKDTSFYSRSDGRQNSIPASLSKFDTTADDDITTHNVIIGSGGLVSQNIPLAVGGNALDTQSQPLYSQNNWYTDRYINSNNFTIEKYTNYLKARKNNTKLTAATLSEIPVGATGIYSIDTDVTLSASQFDGKKIVLVVEGATAFITSNFAPVNGSVAILADTIVISPSVSEINAILIGKQITLGTSATGLKIKGNIIDESALSLDRTQLDGRKPSLFVVFDGQLYLNLLPYLSTSTYDWRQIQ